MRGGKYRSLNSIIYGIIILVCFIFVIIISVPRDECATNFYSLRTLSSDVITHINNIITRGLCTFQVLFINYNIIASR